jgi:AcrR family transcriptional regulator
MIADMGRWEGGASNRLSAAALELFAEQGFAETTVPQITARAGLTTRTFFRHFADKREVLYGWVQHLPAFVEEVMNDAPAHLSPLGVIEWSLDKIARSRLEGQHANLKWHRSLVLTDASLQEREGQKNAALAEAACRAFIKRGLDPLAATVAAHLAMTVFLVSLDRWLDLDTETNLPDLIRDTTARVQQLSGAPQVN